jgi:N6-adenosine-specific RNA methylase IME4
VRSILLTSGPFRGLVRNKYRVILADPPWKFLTRSAKGMGRSPDRHYETMTIDEIKALPVRDLAHKDTVLFMWVIDTHVDMAREIMAAWCFTYKTVGFYWVKTNLDGSDFMGTGYWTRANPEMVFTSRDPDDPQFDVERADLATRGAPRRVGKNVRRLIVARRREHSRKPDEIHQRIEALVDGPYLELFGRQSRPGWTVWGNESTKFDTEVRRMLGIEDPEDLI